MMAKMFYKLDEVKAALGRNEEEIKQFVREGRLREFRDGAQLMFKVEQVEALRNELGFGAAGPGVGPSDSGGPIGLVDSRSASGTGVSLVDSDASARGGSSAGIVLKDDTALAADLGMSGSLGGVPSPGRPGSTGSMAGTRAGSGVNVLSDSEATADASAQTAITGGAVADQVTLEGVGSGSGLLDLTRESDDTSLGAELLDEIAPGGTKRGSKAGSAAAAAGSDAGGTAAGTAAGAPAVGRVPRIGAAPVFVEAHDPLAPAFGGAALGAAIFVLFGGFALMSAVLGTRPPLLEMAAKFSFPIIAGIGVGLALVFFIGGWIVGKSAK